MRIFRSATLPFLAAVTATFFLPERAEAVVELPHGGLFVNAHAETAYTSNLFLTDAEESEVVVTVLPSLEYLLAQGLIHFEARAGVEFLRFIDRSRFDTENFKSDFLLSLPHEERGRNFFLELHGGASERTYATAVDGALIQEDEIEVGGDLQYSVSDRTSLRFGANHRDRDVSTQGFASRRVTTLRVGPAFDYSERLTLSASLRYRTTEVSGVTPALDSEDYSFIAGAEGRLLSRLVGEVALGAQRRNFDGDFDGQTEPYAFAGLTWEADEMTEVILSLTGDMQTSASNLSGQTWLVSLEGVRRVGEKLRFNAGAGFEDSTYVQANGAGRDDDELSAFGGVDYTVNPYVSVGWAVSYARRNSDLDRANYDALRTGISVDARF